MPKPRTDRLAFLVIGFVTMVSTCSFRQESSSSRPNDFVVFSASEAARELPMLRRCGAPILDNVSGTWTPDAAASTFAVAVVRDSLRRVLPSKVAEEAGVTANDYLYQLFGYIWSDRPLILVNGFHEILVEAAVPAQHNWQRMSTVVCDAGYAAFMVVYDPERQSIERWHFDANIRD